MFKINQCGKINQPNYNAAVNILELQAKMGGFIDKKNDKGDATNNLCIVTTYVIPAFNNSVTIPEKSG